MIAIIPARGGSKGLPGKNIKLLDGKPMIAYTIEAALGAKRIDEVFISTDDPDIYEIAVGYGAKASFLRPAELATDTALAVDNYIYTVERLIREFGYRIDTFVVLLPTSPLRTSEDIDAAIKLFEAKDADSVVSYTREVHPLFWHKFLNEDGTFENIFDETIQNRQELRPSYYPNGAIFVFRYNLIKQKKYYTDRSFAYVMPRFRSVDVDTIEDFEYVEFLMRKEEKNG